MDLQITVEANLLITDFLDITFNLTDGTHSPYTKPGNTIKYVAADSNHPPHIKKAIPKAVEAILSKLSSTEAIFQREAPPYKEALREAGYMEEIKFTKATPRKGRPRKVIWFKPPWSDDVATHIGAKFLALLLKHFPSSNNLHKLFNRNTVKLSYGCLPNMGAAISFHNSKLLNSGTNPDPKCNCRGGVTTCPVGGKCLQEDVVYTAEVESEGVTHTYIGSSQEFKSRFIQHKSNFKLPKYEHATTLSTHIWSLSKANKQFNIVWKILARARSYSPETKKCGLCIAEKAKILFFQGTNLLNKRSEVMSKCRHRAKFKLSAL